MVTIRLSRRGAKRAPFYQIVVTDSRARRDSGYIERIGFFNPVARGQETPLQIDLERVDHWLARGAATSDRVAQLVKQHRKQVAAAA
ncbi:SSU ribosomal protein S16p [Thioalkalivibrio nitratireducens DSM 14787]|uniref:Small ribosomal subunit protein bS16 n=1 Tax=Thioalkalivibrio nitratireducens (strain DSM 14787 / UNIQEM 213 / ALEN2) TaxID=1255043 RepID=L0E1H7_THIND|nr:30S ribosomal protein S16 [Thioalkalivibrio nitratireducens]AGA35060.1 SSU ribosomal protein S16p [Thioalkalivibrio nitratireducens DSM 14787]